MSRIRHPNIVSFMGLCTLPPCILTGTGGQCWSGWGVRRPKAVGCVDSVHCGLGHGGFPSGRLTS